MVGLMIFCSRDNLALRIFLYPTLPNFLYYNKASLGELVPLEILVVSTRFNSASLAEISPTVNAVSTVQ